MLLTINKNERPCKLTKQGLEKVKDYISELKAKRKEILDAHKDTANETPLPALKDIISDIEEFFDDSLMEYCNGWGVTDTYNADYPLCLEFGKDIDFI